MHPLKQVLETPAACNPASLIALSAEAVRALAEFRDALQDLHDQCVRECNFRPDYQFLKDIRDEVQTFALRMPNNVALSIIRANIRRLENPSHPITQGTIRV